MKRNILFVHTVCPSQFTTLCDYLNQQSLANAYYLTTEGNRRSNQHQSDRLLSCTPDGNITTNNTYYYSGKVERASRISLGIYREVKELLKHRNIDLIVAHGSSGSPHFLFDEFDIPIITYIEFPSYRLHGWDPYYPPTESQILADKNMEMLSFFEVIKSDLVIVPSNYARNMFPEELQHKISVQFEGFDEDRIQQRESADKFMPRDKFTISFAARDLSSAKGLELFIKIANELCIKFPDMHFMIIGDPKASTYSFERKFLDETYGKESETSFIDHLARKYKIDTSRFTFTGKLSYPIFSDLLYRSNLFIYPLQFGSGNWGLLEILMRGKPVVASNRCFIPEIIRHRANGILVDGDDIEQWIEAISELYSNPPLLENISHSALESTSAYKIKNAAADYLRIFEETIHRHSSRHTK